MEESQESGDGTHLFYDEKELLTPISVLGKSQNPVTSGS